MIPIIEQEMLSVRPVDYPDHLTDDSVKHLLYQRLYHKLVEKDYSKSDKIRDFLTPYIDIMDDKEGTTWSWKPNPPKEERNE